MILKILITSITFFFFFLQPFNLANANPTPDPNQPFYRTNYKDFLPAEMYNIDWAKKLAKSYTKKSYNNQHYLEKAKKVITKCGHFHSNVNNGHIHLIQRVTPAEFFNCLDYPVSFGMKSFKKHKKNQFYAANALLVHELFECDYFAVPHSTTINHKNYLKPNERINFNIKCKKPFLTPELLAQKLFLESKKGAIIFRNQADKSGNYLDETKKIDRNFMKSRIEHFNTLLGFNNFFLKLIAKPFISGEVNRAFNDQDKNNDGFLSLDEMIDVFGGSMSLISKNLGF